jgi:S-adenosyl-L-methionine hydrolase (adenosine-forming)
MAVITFLTDFGFKDGFVGVMHGVVLGIAPDVQIVDISHAISPQNILEGSLVLVNNASYFPPGTIHVAVVDPGVGTARRPLGAKIGNQYFIGPDNGLFTGVIEAAEKAGQPMVFHHLNRPEYWLQQVSHSFHGRDLFSPVAAHLAAGVPLEKMGDLITDPARIMIPQPEVTADGWAGQVLAVDHFGNLLTNLSAEQLAGGNCIVIKIGEARIEELVQTFGDRAPGSLIAMIDSSGELAIAVVNGSAAEKLKVGVGTAVTVKFSKK